MIEWIIGMGIIVGFILYIIGANWIWKIFFEPNHFEVSDLGEMIIMPLVPLGCLCVVIVLLISIFYVLPTAIGSLFI